MNDLVLRLQFDNNIKLIINVSQEDTTSSLIEKIKSLYALHYSKMIQLGSLKDDKGFEIINDIKLSSLFKNGDVLCVFIKEVGDFKSSSSNGLINYDYKENEQRDDNLNKDILNPITNPFVTNPPLLNPPKHITLTSNPPKNITLTSLPKTKLPVKEEERSLTMNPITENNLKDENMKGENMKEKEIKKPRKRRPVVKPKENKNEDKKIKKEEDKIKNEVEDPFSVFEDLKKKNLNDQNLNNQNLNNQNLNDQKVIDTPSKIQPPVLNPIPKENKKDIKELKKKSKVDYNKVDD